MSSSIGLLGVLLALAASGYALTCRNCLTSTSTCSKSNSKPCASASGYQCGVVYLIATTGGANTETYKWACLPEAECNKNGTANSEKVKIKMATSCCNGDDCNPDIPSLPADSSGTSDYKCPSCNSDSSSSCTSSDTIQCAEGESMCLAMSTNASESISLTTAFQGCATDNVCAIGKSLYTDQPKGFSCTEGTKDAKATSAKPEPQKSKSGSTALYNGFYLQAAIYFLVLKSLL